MPYSAAQSGGEVREFPFGSNGGDFRRQEIVERVSPAAGGYFVLLNQRIPPRSRLLWSTLLNVTGLAVSGTNGTDGTANSFAVIAQTASTLTTGTSTATTSILMYASATSSNTLSFNVPSGLTQNTTTNWLYVFLVPAVNGTNVTKTFPATNTNGYKFVGTATDTNTYTIDVSVHYETFAPLTST